MSYRAPGVYVSEVPSLPQGIQPVAAGAALLLGSLPPGLIGDGVPEKQAMAFDSFTAFRESFPGMNQLDEDEDVPPLLSAVHGFFHNGGAALWVALVPAGRDSLQSTDLPNTDELPAMLQMAAPGFTDAASHQVLIDACESSPGRFAILDAPTESVPVSELAKHVAEGGLRPKSVPSGRAALYTPWVHVRDPRGRGELAVPACGHVCGAIARNDANRGVHAAPANIVLRGVIGLSRSFSAQEQAVLNPAGVNAIRAMTGGIRIWGARTLASPDSQEWIYIPVRRLADMILLSVEQGLAGFALEPNSADTRATVRSLVNDFLQGLWQQGMLQGQQSDDAFFVHCDDSNNTAADADAGRLNLEMGIAALRPAEFLVLKSVLKVKQGT